MLTNDPIQVRNSMDNKPLGCDHSRFFVFLLSLSIISWASIKPFQRASQGLLPSMIRSQNGGSYSLSFSTNGITNKFHTTLVEFFDLFTSIQPGTIPKRSKNWNRFIKAAFNSNKIQTNKGIRSDIADEPPAILDCDTSRFSSKEGGTFSVTLCQQNCSTGKTPEN